jgi:hypothetical protein
VVERFTRAPSVLREAEVGYRRRAPCPSTGVASEPSTAVLEVAGSFHRLGVASTLQFEVDRIVFRAAAADDAMFVRHADGALWLHGDRHLLLAYLNGRMVGTTESMPLYDGDVLRIDAHTFRGGAHRDAELTAIVHDREPPGAR